MALSSQAQSKGAARVARAKRAATFLARRLIQAVIVMLLVVLLNFSVMQLAPGDMVSVISGSSDVTAEQLVTLRAQFGLDEPWPVRLGLYLWNLAQFDLGYSYRNAAPVIEVIMARFPTTLMLVVASVICSVTIGTLLGVIAARRAGKPLDLLILGFALLLYATPSFIVAILLILIFGVWLKALPIGGLLTLGVDL